MPGAGGIKAANYVYTVAPKDGTALGTFSVGALIDELFGTSTTSFDTTKFGWIGNMDESVGVCVVKSRVRRAQVRRPAAEGDAVRRHRSRRRRDPGGDRAHASLWRQDQADQGLSRARRTWCWRWTAARSQGVCGITIAVLKSRLAHQIKSGELVPIIHDAMKPHPELPGVPSVYDFAKSDDDRKVLDLLFGWRVLGRPIAAPPGVPAERLAALRKAFFDAMNDKRFIADAAKAQLDIAPAPGEEVASLIARLFSHSKDTVKRAADAVRN